MSQEQKESADSSVSAQELHQVMEYVMDPDFGYCTFPEGYTSQDVYVCLTCNEVAGLCFGCANSCHEKHNILDLGLKRHFRCDCGTKVLADKCHCALLDGIERDMHVNEENKYNHNFSGKFCLCDQPYNEQTETSDMIQCVICEDWFHEQCLGAVPPSDAYDTFYCQKCASQHPFLFRYPHVLPTAATTATTTSVEDSSTVQPPQPPSADSATPTTSAADVTADATADATATTADATPANTVQNSTTATTPGSCILPAAVPASPPQPLFLKGNISDLCKCAQCKQMYQQEGLGFFLDPDDHFAIADEPEVEPQDSATARVEKRSREDSENEAIAGMLSALPHTQRIDVINGFNHFSQSLRDFLGSYARNKKVVTDKDIRNFVSNMRGPDSNSRGGML